MGFLQGCTRPLLAITLGLGLIAQAPAATGAELSPLVKAGSPDQWVFAFKLNARKFPTKLSDAGGDCLYGGDKMTAGAVGQRYFMASKGSPTLKDGPGQIGTSDQDPLGATFGQIYTGKYHYIVWNDQFDDQPLVHGGERATGTWAHAKGMVAWDEDGHGVVIQVTTPDWPRSASQAFPRKNEGNTLGCMAHNNVIFSQHFFALKLSHADVKKVLNALQTASVVTDTSMKVDPHTGKKVPVYPELFNNGGPPDIQLAATNVGVAQSTTTTATLDKLDSGVELIAKPSDLWAPPWQVVSSMLEGEPLRVANWWGPKPKDQPVPDTKAGETHTCWPKGQGPGDVSTVHGGVWDTTDFNLELATPQNGDGNHAKIGISAKNAKQLVIFGDENQAGFLDPGQGDTCEHSQFKRGGLFFVVASPKLWTGLDAAFKEGAADGGAVNDKAAPAPRHRRPRTKPTS